MPRRGKYQQPGSLLPVTAMQQYVFCVSEYRCLHLQGVFTAHNRSGCSLCPGYFVNAPKMNLSFLPRRACPASFDEEKPMARALHVSLMLKQKMASTKKTPHQGYPSRQREIFLKGTMVSAMSTSTTSGYVVAFGWHKKALPSNFSIPS